MKSWLRGIYYLASNGLYVTVNYWRFYDAFDIVHDIYDFAPKRLWLRDSELIKFPELQDFTYRKPFDEKPQVIITTAEWAFPRI